MTWYGREEALPCHTIEEFKTYLQSLHGGWRPSGMALHNTASPTLYQWWHGGTSPEQRMKNLRNYYENDMGWSSGPHAFIDGEDIWVFVDFNVKGVHSPSWNGTKLGIEMVGDYDTETDESGQGKKVMDLTVALFGVCHDYFGWDPDTIKLHKEDPATDHDCPGSNIVKSEFISDVTEYMGSGGGDTDTPQQPRQGTVVNLDPGDTLNIRAQSSSSSPVIGTAAEGAIVTIIGEAWNGSTQWLRIQGGQGGIAVYGWVSADYVDVEEAPPEALLHVKGKCSWFGGPEDMGVDADEGLAFIYDYDQAPYLFLDQQPPGTTGLARRLNTEHVYYVACRWDYDVTPKDMLAQDIKALVRANGKEFLAWPADWGPHEDTGRVADISHVLMRALGIETDDEVEVIYPAEEHVA
jgi:hypothetical protein